MAYFSKVESWRSIRFGSSRVWVQSMKIDDQELPLCRSFPAAERLGELLDYFLKAMERSSKERRTGS